MRLLNPKVQSMSRMWCTEKQMLQVLKKLKMKKYGFKEYAVDIQETIWDGKPVKYFSKHNGQRIAFGDEKLNRDEVYYHVYVEYII